MVTGWGELRGTEREMGKDREGVEGGGGGMLSFREASTGGRDRWRQKLGGSWGRFTFRVYNKRVQECKANKQ